MQLSGIVAFLLLQYGVSSSRDSHFAEELRDFQESLIKHIYEGTHLDPKEDDAEIEALTKAILAEADERLKKRKQIRDEYRLKDEVVNKWDRSLAYENAYRYLASDVFRDILKSHNVYLLKDTDHGQLNDDYDDSSHDVQANHVKEEHKRDIDDVQMEEMIDKRSTEQMGDEVIVQNVASEQKDRSGRRVADVGDNDQVASVAVDNTPDDPANSKIEFLEPNLNVSKEKNRSSYAAHHRLKGIPPRIITNKVDRSGLDRISFIAIIIACCIAGIAGIGLASFCWYKLRSESKDFKNGSTNFKAGSLRNSGYGKKLGEEDKLARGAEVYHYLHAKKQIQQMEEPSMKLSDRGCSINESTDDEEEEEDTVYECPGLAPPGDMKVVNPLFSDGESHYSDSQQSQKSSPTPPLDEK